MRLKKNLPNPLTRGDVIQTNPKRGFWGCAVVLSAYDGTESSFPISHIGITPFIVNKKYVWNSVDPAALTVLAHRIEARLGPNEWVLEQDPRTCIDMYVVPSIAGLRIIGRVDASGVYSRRLSLEVGDGTKGRFPFSGTIPDDLGSEAVWEWQRIHDSARHERETARDRRLGEKIEQQLRDEAKTARNARARKKTI